jgi:hypothetical protein
MLDQSDPAAQVSFPVIEKARTFANYTDRVQCEDSFPEYGQDASKGGSSGGPSLQPGRSKYSIPGTMFGKTAVETRLIL